MFFRCLLSGILLYVVSGWADFQDHLKGCPDKGPHHSIENVDFIYLINLDERPEKLAKCLSQLAPYGIHPYRFSAVNGWKLTLETINDIGLVWEPWMTNNQKATFYYDQTLQSNDSELACVPGRTYFCHCTARGTIGIMLSHLSVLHDAYHSGYETIWVMEDDIQVIRNPHEISALITELDRLVDKDWDILFMDRDGKDLNGNYVPCFSYEKRPNFTPKNPDRFAKKTAVGRYFEQIGARYCPTSMIVRRSGMEKLLEFHKKYALFLPFDMDMTQPDDIKLFCVTNDIISNRAGAESDNGGPYYLLNTNHRNE